MDRDWTADGAFARTGAAARTESAKLTASDGAAADLLGVSVAIAGDIIVAGAPYDDVGAIVDEGSAYTFARSGAAARTQTAKLTVAAAQLPSDDRFGGSVAVDGETIVVGARYHDANSNADQGSVYTFARTGAAVRTPTATLSASDGTANDQLGGSVAIGGGTPSSAAPPQTTSARTALRALPINSRAGAPRRAPRPRG